LNLDQNDPDAWKIYAEKVRDIMSKCLDVPKTDHGYRTWCAFYDELGDEVDKT